MNTVTTSALYQKIISNPLKIHWLDIFNGALKKHDEKDSDYALIAGTSLDTVTSEIGMLQKWQNPWMFLKVLRTGLLVSLISLGAVLAQILLFDISQYPALNILFIVIPPCVMPITLMVFFWEMNVPRDISIMKMIGYFFTGGVLSLLITTLLLAVIPGGGVLAPLVEEPAKLLASIYFLNKIYQKKGKVYGFTGLAIGAAVGAGFAAFESIQYAFNQLPTIMVEDIIPAQIMILSLDGLIPVFVNIVMRFVCAICGHVLYCAPYSCIVALNMEKSGDANAAIKDKSFVIVFAISFVMHMIWNTSVGGFVGLLVKLVIVTALLWSTTLYGVRRSFAQLTGKIQVSAGNNQGSIQHRIQGTKGIHAGIAFSIKKAEILVGTDSACQLTYPVNTADIDKNHCKLLLQNGGLYLADLGSQGGTYLNNTKLKPMTGYLLKSGDRFSLGTGGQEFVVL